MATKTTSTPPPNSACLPTPDVLPADGYSRWSTLKAFVPFSRETLRKRELAGLFPKRLHLGSERCAAWSNREVHRWLADPANYRVKG